jgi:uncharacterized protein with PhoU and TrkA domain
VLVALFRSAGLSAAQAYLAAGMLAGPSGFGWLPDEAMARQLANDRSLDFPEQMRSVSVGENHHAVGRTPEELCLQKCGVELMDVRRGAIRVPGRPQDTRLRTGDVLLIKGRREPLEKAIACLTEGR